jgi:hypothetical protein
MIDYHYMKLFKPFLYFSSGSGLKKGKSRLLYGLPGYSAVAVTGLGKQGLGYNEQEDINEGLEAIRTAAAGQK